MTVKKADALYIHIPFCASLCHYCDFCKMYYEKTRADAYLVALSDELDFYRIPEVATIYIGGGTPSALSYFHLRRLLKKVSPMLSENGEFTVECNIESVTEAKLRLFREYCVTRISVGVQSFDNKVLKSLNRLHKEKDIITKIRLVRKYGFDFSVDLIYDLPGSDFRILKDDLRKCLALKADHISIYSLTIHPQTVFGIRKVQPVGQDISRRNYDFVLAYLRKKGYERYEVSNFARKNKYSRHNMTYWKNESYYGAGLGASGYLDGIRYENTKNLSSYLKGQYKDREEKVEIKEEEEYYLMLGLRMEQGFDGDDFYKHFGHRFEDTYIDEISSLVARGLLTKSGTRWKATDDGIILLDYLLIRLLKD